MTIRKREKMKIKQIIEIDGIELLNKIDVDLEKQVTGCYISDLLSWVMAHAKEGEAWLTIMNHLNILAVASLLDLSCIIVAEGEKVSEEVVKVADEKNVIMLSSKYNLYQTAKLLSGLGL